MISDKDIVRMAWNEGWDDAVVGKVGDNPYDERADLPLFTAYKHAQEEYLLTLKYWGQGDEIV